MNVPAWPWTTTSRRSWLGRPSSYLASTQQPLISSFHRGYDSKSATMAMIDAAEAATSTVLLTIGIGRLYKCRLSFAETVVPVVNSRAQRQGMLFRCSGGAMSRALTHRGVVR